MFYKYEVVLVWQDGEKSRKKFTTIEKAKEYIYRMRTAFGNQIQYDGINDLR
jgi:hypothetical protein